MFRNATSVASLKQGGVPGREYTVKYKAPEGSKDRHRFRLTWVSGCSCCGQCKYMLTITAAGEADRISRTLAALGVAKWCLTPQFIESLTATAPPSARVVRVRPETFARFLDTRAVPHIGEGVDVWLSKSVVSMRTGRPGKCDTLRWDPLAQKLTLVRRAYDWAIVDPADSTVVAANIP